jgi:hypothetical protein
MTEPNYITSKNAQNMWLGWTYWKLSNNKTIPNPYVACIMLFARTPELWIKC